MQNVAFITIKFHFIGIYLEFQSVRTVLKVDFYFYYPFQLCAIQIS